MSSPAQGLPTDGQKFAALRRKLGLSQTDAGLKLGLTMRGVQEIEGSAGPVRASYMLALELLAMIVAVERRDPSIATPQGRQLAISLRDVIMGA